MLTQLFRTGAENEEQKLNMEQLNTEETTQVVENSPETGTPQTPTEPIAEQPKPEAPKDEQIESSTEEDENPNESWDLERGKTAIRRIRGERNQAKDKLAEALRANETLLAQVREAQSSLSSFEQKKAIEEGTLETLAEKRAQELIDAKANFLNERQQYENRLEKMTKESQGVYAEAHTLVDSLIRDWPDEAKALVPNREEVDPATRLKQMNLALPLVEKLLAKEKEAVNVPGTPIDPVPSNRTPLSPNPETAIRQQGRYSTVL